MPKRVLVLETNKGDITIELLSDLAPKHCERILQLSKDKYFDDVVFHRVIEGFMAQTGDGQYGSLKNGSKLIVLEWVDLICLILKQNSLLSPL